MPQDLFSDPGPDGEEPGSSPRPPAAGGGPEDGWGGPAGQGLYVCLPAGEITLEGFAQGGRADTMAPGPLLATIVDAVTGEDAKGLAGCSDDQLMGMLSSREYEGYYKKTGRRDLHIALVGTRAAGRNRGIASALLVTAMSAARASGYDRASLTVDADSLTGAVRLYERVGFAVDHTRAAYRKQLTASS